MSGYWQGVRRKWWWWRQGRWRSEHIGVMWVRRGLQGRGEAVGGALVSRQGQREGGGCCRWRRWVVGRVQRGSRGPVGLRARGAAPAAVKRKVRRSRVKSGVISQNEHLFLCIPSSPSATTLNYPHSVFTLRLSPIYKRLPPSPLRFTVSRANMIRENTTFTTPFGCK